MRIVVLLSVLGILGVGLGGCVAGAASVTPEAAPADPQPAEPRPAVNPLDDPAAELALWMHGFFRSARQAASDPAYAAIDLHVVPVWPERTDGPWLYVEQAAAETPDAPYRQRVYRLRTLGPGQVASEVYALPGGGTDYVGAWQRSAPLLGLSPDDLDLRDGCTVYLERQPNRTYTGATRGQTCVSRLRGASYATSAVTIGQEGMQNWDRGFSAGGAQVWGPESGPYRFDRVED